MSGDINISQVGGVQPLLSTATAAALPTKPPATSGKAISAKELSQNVAKAATKRPDFGGEVLQTYIRNANSTIKLMGSAFKELNELFKGKWKEGSPISAVLGVTFSGGSLLLQASIKAVIWTPVLALTALAAAGGGLAMALSLPGLILFGNPEDAFKAGAAISATIAGGVLGAAATLVSGLSIVGRWPLMLTADLGSILLTPKGSNSKDERLLKLDIAHQQTYQDSLSLWSGGSDSVLWRAAWAGGKKDLDKRSELLLMALDAGADPYGSMWFGDYNFVDAVNEGREEQLLTHREATKDKIDEVIRLLRHQMQQNLQSKGIDVAKPELTEAASSHRESVSKRPSVTEDVVTDDGGEQSVTDQAKGRDEFVSKRSSVTESSSEKISGDEQVEEPRKSVDEPPPQVKEEPTKKGKPRTSLDERYGKVIKEFEDTTGNKEKV